MIRFVDVTKRYPGTSKPALNKIDLEVLSGEFVFLVGASGSGKSSCLRLVLREERLTSGTLQVLGQDLSRISSRKVPYFRRNIGVVFQDFRLLPNKTVFDNVAFTLKVIGKSRGFIQEAVPDVLGMVGLTGKESRFPHELSGGEQQRVAIARAVVNKPQVLLADEPTGNLDPATSQGIMTLLERINAGGTTILMATHEAAIVDKMQQRVIELVGGEIIRDERHGGYATTAIPLQAAEPQSQPVATASAPTVVKDAPAASQPDVDAPFRPVRQAAAPVAVPTPATTPATTPAPATPTPATAPASAAVPTRVTVPEEPAAEKPAAESPTVPEASAPEYFSRPPTQPILRSRSAHEDELTEHLGLAARLGLREARHDDDEDEQNVGPTR